jgi:hypothetical protein
MATTKAVPAVPTYQNNWGEITESKPFHKETGVEIVKANKTTVTPKAGAQPLFNYVNKAGATGSWYDVADVNIVTKENRELLKELQKQRDDLFKEFRSHNISSDAFIAREGELAELITQLAQA